MLLWQIMQYIEKQFIELLNFNISKSSRLLGIGYHMSGEVISVLSLVGRYYKCDERGSERDNYDIVTRVIQLISPSQSCDNLFIYYILVPLSGFK